MGVTSSYVALSLTITSLLFRLQAASEEYHHVLSKKKESPASGEAEKLMPLDALGIVMVTHGEEYGDDSAFGALSVRLDGRAWGTQWYSSN